MVGTNKKMAGKTSTKGRPPLRAGEAKRSSYNTRIRSDLKARLERDASNVGRSLSEEIEFRLENSVIFDDAMEREFGSAQLQTLFRSMAATVAIIEAKTGKAWTEDWDTGAAVETGWRRVVRQYMPDFPKDMRADSETDSPGVAPNKPVTTYEPAKNPGLFSNQPTVIEPSADEWAKYEKELAKHAKKQQAHDEARQRLMGRFDAADSLGKETASFEIKKISRD